jgi:hypothetical protein
MNCSNNNNLYNKCYLNIIKIVPDVMESCTALAMLSNNLLTI